MTSRKLLKNFTAKFEFDSSNKCDRNIFIIKKIMK